MALAVREMAPDETGLIVDYFHRSSLEHLEMMGVDPSRLPTPDAWRERYRLDFERPYDRRASLLVIWTSDDRPIGFSTTDKIVFGDRANMHLHIVDPENRRGGLGADCVRRTLDIYFDRLRLRSLFCEPNALNVAPNRTLQKAGFRYVKTYITVPGPLTFHQPVTRWVVER
jgi:RimJ/RimL family protein N-acetyltransferase